MARLLLCLLVAVFATVGYAGEVSCDANALRSDLEAAFKRDQHDRLLSRELAAAARNKETAVNESERRALWDKINQLDLANQQFLDEVVVRCGWPKSSQVGARAASAAFLIVQHASLGFKLKYLPIMRELAKEGELPMHQLALLEDRVRTSQKLPQLYGSQVDTKDGVTLLPVEDEAGLDKRRAQVGLPPICKYLEGFVKFYGSIRYSKCLATESR
ncbi:DUF6624 domain-containing protein [Chitinimonas sp. BJYL2]|uniref:DUF6624 domain-containing protein n=1 Tax=Chitinimonas sp. BJYL2 TaxID=2976696 RepID=UPI0022B55F48|nr:DUF6624 domain-containing protein [Chitinimonas sp. BJYL2]